MFKSNSPGKLLIRGWEHILCEYASHIFLTHETPSQEFRKFSYKTIEKNFTNFFFFHKNLLKMILYFFYDNLLKKCLPIFSQNFVFLKLFLKSFFFVKTYHTNFLLLFSLKSRLEVFFFKTFLIFLFSNTIQPEIEKIDLKNFF